MDEMIYYTATITEIGKEALTEKDLIILFRNNAPEDLKEYCILHDGNVINDTITEGLNLIIGESSFKICSVGNLAVQNLHTLGHITLRFSDKEAENPGDICLKGGEKPPILVGDKIIIKT